MALHRTPGALRLQDLAPVPLADRVLMADPQEFDVVYAINPHMTDEAGGRPRVAREEARRQWWCLREAIEELGVHVDVVPPLAGHPDLVFCANQTLPVQEAITGGQPELIASHMASSERAAEVPHIVQFLRGLGYRAQALAGRDLRLEGMGDGLWHPGRRLLWAGVGPRSEEAAWAEVAARYDLEVALLDLVDPDFYHLDTALCLIDERTCLWYPGAFSSDGRALVESLFERPLAVPEDEARRGFACNAFSPDGQHVLIQRGLTRSNELLTEAGYTVVELETGEFMKSGGSVFCMKLHHGPLADAPLE